MKTYSPLVGAHFRPPAKAILGVLPNSTPLRLEREPSNDYDPNAIKVLAASSAIPQSQYGELEAQALGFGFDTEAILAQEWHHLVYVAAKPSKGRSGTLAIDIAK